MSLFSIGTSGIFSSNNPLLVVSFLFTTLPTPDNGATSFSVTTASFPRAGDSFSAFGFTDSVATFPSVSLWVCAMTPWLMNIVANKTEANPVENFLSEKRCLLFHCFLIKFTCFL